MKTLIERPIQASARCKLPADIHPVLRRVYAARQVSGEEELDHRLARLHSPASLKGLPQAVDLLT